MPYFSPLPGLEVAEIFYSCGSGQVVGSGGRVRWSGQVVGSPVSKIRAVAGPKKIQRCWMYKDPALLDVQRYSAAGCTKIQRRWKWTDTGLLEVNRYSAVRVEWLDIKTWVKSVQLEWIRDILGLKFWFPTSWVLMLSMVLGGCVGVKELGSILEFWRSLHIKS